MNLRLFSRSLRETHFSTGRAGSRVFVLYDCNQVRAPGVNVQMPGVPHWHRARCIHPRLGAYRLPCRVITWRGDCVLPRGTSAGPGRHLISSSVTVTGRLGLRPRRDRAVAVLACARLDEDGSQILRRKNTGTALRLAGQEELFMVPRSIPRTSSMTHRGHGEIRVKCDSKCGTGLREP